MCWSVANLLDFRGSAGPAGSPAFIQRKNICTANTANKQNIRSPPKEHFLWLSQHLLHNIILLQKKTTPQHSPAQKTKAKILVCRGSVALLYQARANGYVGGGKCSSRGILFSTWATYWCLSLAAGLWPTGWQGTGRQCCSGAPTTSLKLYFALFLMVCNAKSWQRNLSALRMSWIRVNLCCFGFGEFSLAALWVTVTSSLWRGCPVCVVHSTER